MKRPGIRGVPAGLYVTILALMISGCGGGSAEPAPQTLTILRASVADNGAQGNGGCPAKFHLSGNGDVVAFISSASNLVPGDTNGVEDVFIHSVSGGWTRIVSVADNGAPADDASYSLSISRDGTRIAFESSATNLVPGDSNGWSDVFVRDTTTGKTVLASLATDSAQADAHATKPFISAGGRYVVFESMATNLVPGGGGGIRQIYLRDLQDNTTRLISLDNTGVPGDGNSSWPSASADGQIVAFSSDAANLVAGDTNGCRDIFVRNLNDNTTRRVSVSSSGAEGNGESHRAQVSGDGRFVVFYSDADNLAANDNNSWRDVFRHEIATGQTLLASVATDGGGGDNQSDDPSVSADGRYVGLESQAGNLVSFPMPAPFFHVYVRDMASGITRLSSRTASGGTDEDGDSVYSSLSDDGQRCAFNSSSTNLVPGDTNGMEDIFVSGW